MRLPVLEVWHESGAEVLAATYGGNRGHPALLSREVWDRVPDEGARSLPALLVPCDDLGTPGDIDAPEDLPERFRER
jgi:nicotine blue oxidoreductase